jgi:phosphatidylserine/phosphatidylglycerophosphate/cardiolipin synthase-like enzyme
MKKTPLFSLAVVILLSLTAPVQSADAPKVQVFFSPNGGGTAAITNALSNAKKTILVQAYSFTSAPIAKALVDAHRRGVKIQVILDKSQRTEKYSSADFVHNASIPTFIDDKHAIAHNKLMVIDGTKVVTGSFNFTKAAEEKNAENLLIIEDPVLAAKYSDNWNSHLKHSVRYEGHARVVDPKVKK